MSPARTQSSLPDTSELVEGFIHAPIAIVICSTVLPGLLMCAPALIFGALLVIVPLAAVALVVAVVGAIVAAPFVLVRAVRVRLVARQSNTSGSMRRASRSARFAPALLSTTTMRRAASPSTTTELNP
jgi:hypothetical protein